MAISHADHNHPNTPAARTACRKRLSAGKSPMDASAERALNVVKEKSFSQIHAESMMESTRARVARLKEPIYVTVEEVRPPVLGPVSDDNFQMNTTITGERARIAQDIAFYGYGVATITSRQWDGEEHTGTYKVFTIEADGFSVKEYSGGESTISFGSIIYIGR